jgi:hypothetical protein
MFLEIFFFVLPVRSGGAIRKDKEEKFVFLKRVFINLQSAAPFAILSRTSFAARSIARSAATSSK